MTGCVERDLALRLEDLRAMPRRTITAFLECADNGRTRFEPVPDGTPWLNDAAGNAVWSGVPLGAILDLAGVQDGAVDVVAQGGDFPEMRRGLLFAIARHPDTLVVLEMNGERAFSGFWNSDNYVYWSADGTPLRSVTEMPVKSVSRPRNHPGPSAH